MAEIRTLGTNTIKTYLTMLLWQNVKGLKELKKHVFLPVDKVRHDCAVMCKASYCKPLKNEMEGYEKVENILKNGLTKTNKKLKFPKITGTVPYLLI